jgi:Tol biopolymer transport system component
MQLAAASAAEGVRYIRRPGDLPVGRMTVVSDITGTNEVWVFDEDGSTRQLTKARLVRRVKVWGTVGQRRKDGTMGERKVPSLSGAYVNEAALSPNGEWVAYGLYNAPHHAIEIWVVRADGKQEPTLLTTGHSDFDPFWFLDSKRIGFERVRDVGDGSADDIYVVDREKKGPEQLLASLGDDWKIVKMACSPDGKTIVIERFGPMPPEGGLVCRFHSLWTLDVESGKTSKLPLKGESFWRPAWFPDGSGIVYLALKHVEAPWELRKCRPDGSGEECLFSSLDDLDDPTVSPDGRYVAFSREMWLWGPSRIRVLEIATGRLSELATSRVHTLIPKEHPSWESPSWGPMPAEAGQDTEEQTGPESKAE